MAAVIQIPRGVLERYKYGEGHLPQGSLFWQPRNLFEKNDSGHNPDGLELLLSKYDSSQYREKHW